MYIYIYTIIKTFQVENAYSVGLKVALITIMVQTQKGFCF